MSPDLWAEAGVGREGLLLQKSKQRAGCPAGVQAQVISMLLVFHQSSSEAVLGNSVLPNSGSQES